MFSLVALAFVACSVKDRKSFNNNVAHSKRVRMRKCCYRLMLTTRQPPSRNPRNTKTCYLAARHGHLECLRMARRLGCPWDRRTCHVAASTGHTECLMFAYAHMCPTDETTLRRAVRNGQMHCVQFLMRTGLHIWDVEYMYDAVKSGSLDLVAFLHENGCPWTSLLMGMVATAGRLDIMRYAHEHGCPWQEDTSTRALAYENFECMEYAREHGCPLAPNSDRLLSGLLCMVRMQPPGGTSL